MVNNIPWHSAVSVSIRLTTPEWCRLSGGTVTGARSPGGSDWRAFTAWPSKPQPRYFSSSGSWLGNFHRATRRCTETGAWGVGSSWSPAWVWSLSLRFNLRLRLCLCFTFLWTPLFHRSSVRPAQQFSRAIVNSSQLKWFSLLALFSGQNS